MPFPIIYSKKTIESFLFECESNDKKDKKIKALEQENARLRNHWLARLLIKDKK